jgi:hypothetical protein
MGDAGNEVIWTLQSDLTANPAVCDTIKDNQTHSGEMWVDTTLIDAASDTAAIEIKYIDALFDDGDTTYLVYSEINAATGACIAKRATPVIRITGNNFALAGADSISDCNSWSGVVFPNEVDITSKQESMVTFSVEMTKSANHYIKEWSFSGTVNTVGTGYTPPDSLFTEENMSATTFNNRGTYTIDWEEGDGNTFVLTVTIDSEDITADYTADEVDITCNLFGPATEEVEVTLTISEGVAVSGTEYNVETDDNSEDDNEQVITKYAIPATSVIAISH